MSDFYNDYDDFEDDDDEFYDDSNLYDEYDDDLDDTDYDDFLLHARTFQMLEKNIINYSDEKKWEKNNILDKWGEETLFSEYTQILTFEKINNISNYDSFYFTIVPELFLIQIKINRPIGLSITHSYFYCKNIRLSLKNGENVYSIPLNFKKQLDKDGTGFLHTTYSYVPNYIELLETLTKDTTVKLFFEWENIDAFGKLEQWDALMTLGGKLPLGVSYIDTLSEKFEQYKKKCFDNLKNDSLKVLNQYELLDKKLMEEVKHCFSAGTVKAVSDIVISGVTDKCLNYLKLQNATNLTFENLVIFYQGFFSERVVNIAYKKLVKR